MDPGKQLDARTVIRVAGERRRDERTRVADEHAY
jgi:hypothetical protein